MITLQNASFGYHRKPVIRCPQLRITPGRCLGIYGANGSGKSTLLRGIAGVLRPLSGTVSSSGARPVIALVPQRQGIDSAWPMTARDAAAMAVSARTWCGWIGGTNCRIEECMQTLGVANLARRPFAQLSGGQQQRVLLAGALACRPQLLLLDEPAEGLDAGSTHGLLELLRTQVAQGVAVVMISHEAGELARVADSFAWVEVAALPEQPNELALLERREFLLRATGNDRIPTMSPLESP